MKLLPELPLLRRELTELANRKRTYVVRVLGAIGILLVLFVAYSRAAQSVLLVRGGFRASWEQLLGIGGDIFRYLAPALFYSIQILMPALCCAAVSAEKENNTIGTLLLTRLSPLTIVLEKLGSRLVPMLTLLLITFPVLAYVFSLGGVDTDMLIATLWLLFCECLLFASIAILCSVWFPTTVGAFIWSYVLIGIFAAFSLSLNFRTFVPSALWHEMVAKPEGWATIQAYLANPIKVDASEYVPFWLRAIIMGYPLMATMMAEAPWVLVVMQSAVSLAMACMCLAMARWLLVPRAFVSHSSFLLKIFGYVDSFFKALNERTTGGVELIADSNTLPNNDPVAWRERAKKSLGKARYLFRILVVLEVPTLFICMFTAILSSQREFRQLYILQVLIWLLAGLVVCMKGATLFSSERARETIEPLLASPMTAVDMVRQKVSGMSRLMIVMATPILTVNFTTFCLKIQTSRWLSTANYRALTYLGLSLVATFVFLYLMTWISTGIGLKIHSQTKAVLTASFLIAAWSVTPFVVLLFAQPNMYVSEVLWSLSPASLVTGAECYLLDVPYRVADRWGYANGSERFPWLIFCCMRIAIYGGLLFLVVAGIRGLSPRLLNRLESPSEDASSSRRATPRLPVLEGATQA